LARSGAYYVCRVVDGEPVSGHRPSVDVLFRSVAETARANATGVILTGMGSDGAAGLCAMRDAGARTIGQDEASSLIYGMPKVAKQMGGVARELPLHAIAGEILDGATCEVAR
jgi:two-component system chemotaxis response regulator CheB